MNNTVTNNDPASMLYPAANKLFQGVGTIEDFRTSLASSDKRKKLYDELKAKGVQTGGYDQFDKWISQAYENPANVAIEKPVRPGIDNTQPTPGPADQFSVTGTGSGTGNGQVAQEILSQAIDTAKKQPAEATQEPGQTTQGPIPDDYEQLVDYHNRYVEENRTLAEPFENQRSRDLDQGTAALNPNVAISIGLTGKKNAAKPDEEFVKKNQKAYEEYTAKEAMLRDKIARHPKRKEIVNKTLFEAENEAERLKSLYEQFTKENEDAIFLAKARSVRGAAGMRVLGPSKEQAEVLSQRNALNSAIELNKKTQAVLQAPSRYDDSNAFANFAKGAGSRATDMDFWAFGLTNIARNLDIRDVAIKLQEAQEQYGENVDVDAILTGPEKALIGAFYNNLHASALRVDDLSLGYQAGQGAMDSAKFMAEFILTGGITRAATKGATKALETWIIKNVASKVGKTLAKGGLAVAKGLMQTAVRTPLMPSTYSNISDKAVQYDENGNLINGFEAICPGATFIAVALYARV